MDIFDSVFTVSPIFCLSNVIDFLLRSKLRGPNMASYDSVCGVECLTWRTNGRELEVKAVNTMQGCNLEGKIDFNVQILERGKSESLKAVFLLGNV